ncbi:MAG TPA: hypothetical protein VGM50_21910, partial [Gemmatimonadaceae bacterium]
ACSKSSNNQAQQTANGSLDTASVRTGADVPAEGPYVQVTRTDGKSVTRSTQYELTSDNFTHFIAAADSLTALTQRDSTARNYLSQDITDAGASDMDAGIKWLDANPAVSAAINNAGISTKDYFVQSLAIAAAERFITDPKAAPPTPVLAKNAKFLGAHQDELAHLRALRSGKPSVTVSP